MLYVMVLAMVSLIFIRNTLFMATTEVYSNGNGRLNVKTLPEKGPSLIKVVPRASHLKVIIIDDKEHTKSKVEVARWSFDADRLNPTLFKCLSQCCSHIVPLSGSLQSARNNGTTGFLKCPHEPGRASGGRHIQHGAPESSAWM